MTIENYKARQTKNKQSAKGMIQYNPEFKSGSSKLRWVENPEDGLRLAGTSSDICKEEGGRMDHTGWYVNSFQDETCNGLVFQLPARKSKEVFLAGVSDPNGNNGAMIEFREAFNNKLEAARYADQLAERYAEDAREDDAKFQAEAAIEDARAEIETLYVDFKKLAVELRANCDKLAGMDELKKLLHREYRSTRSRVRKLRAKIAKLEDNYWEAVPGY